jgi:hypothetical protein
MVDADTGEVIDSGPATVSGGQATASPDTGKLKDHPETSNVNVRITADGQTTETGAIAMGPSTCCCSTARSSTTRATARAPFASRRACTP